MQQAVKAVSFVQNYLTPGGTLDTEQETIAKVFKEVRSKNEVQPSRPNEDVLYQFRSQNKVLCDLKQETAGLNRFPNESWQEYMMRLQKHDFLEHSIDYSLAEFVPKAMERFNQKIKTHESTYYFSYTTGERNRTDVGSFKELLKQPSKSSEAMLGFDCDLVQNLKLLGSA